MTDVISPARTRVLLALINVYQRDGRATVREVAEAADKSPSTAYTMLLRLRDMGLVYWQPEHAGTLRPAVAPTRTYVRKMVCGSTNVAGELVDPRGVGAPGGLADGPALRTGEAST